MATIAREQPLISALGVYVFLRAADTATRGRGYPLGPALRR
jgi:hypothetical protein